MFNDNDNFLHVLMLVLISIMFVCVIADSFQIYRQSKIIQKIERKQKKIDKQMDFYNMLNANTIRQKRILNLLKKRAKKQKKIKRSKGFSHE